MCLLLGALMGVLVTGRATAAAEAEVQARLRAAIREERTADALTLAEQALEQQKEDTVLLSLHAQLCERERLFAKAVQSYDRLLALEPNRDALWHQRGVAKFMAGDFEGSVKDFDHYLEENPQRMPSHWQRGLSHYGANMFKEGRAQFEAHQTVNTNDVENAAWHFICVARLEGVDAARKALIPIKGDARVPMVQVHDLFAGEGTEADVLEAAGKEHPNRRNHLCYAHLYLALYKEALGKPKEALAHYKLAAEDHRMEHYMGETAVVFYKDRLKKAKASEKREEAEAVSKPK